jgi:hypothetical protein
MFVTATESPDGGGVALVLRGHDLDALAEANGQDDTGPLDGSKRKGTTVRDLL